MQTGRDSGYIYVRFYKLQRLEIHCVLEHGHNK